MDELSKLDRPVSTLVAEATASVSAVSVDALRDRLADGVVALDVRDVRERWIHGTIPDARHLPRGMAEFWADPSSAYHRDFLDPDGSYVCFCNDTPRAALTAARLSDLGYRDVAYLDGGLPAWEAAGGDVADVPQKTY